MPQGMCSRLFVMTCVSASCYSICAVYYVIDVYCVCHCGCSLRLFYFVMALCLFIFIALCIPVTVATSAKMNRSTEY